MWPSAQVVGDVGRGTVPEVNRLAVLRHAKATHEPGFRDIDRPLTRRGQRDAAAVGRFLRIQGSFPIWLSSNSSRTTQTWEYLAAGAAGGPDGAPEASAGDPGAPGKARPARAGDAGKAGATGKAKAVGVVDPASVAGRVSYDPRIYDAGTEDLLEIIRETPAKVRTLMIVGHNPAVHELVLVLTGDHYVVFPTCALAVIDLPGRWEQTSAEGGRLGLFWTPKGAAL